MEQSDMGRPEGRKGRRYKYKSKYYHPRELAALPECEVDAKLLDARLTRGWSVEEAVTTPNRREASERFEYDGQQLTLRKIFKTYPHAEGLTFQTFYHRIKVQYWSIDKALTLPTHGRAVKDNARRWEYFGKRLTVNELARLPVCKVDVQTLNSRLRRGWDVLEALVKLPNDSGKSDRFTAEERAYWDKWLATPLEVIKERAMKNLEEEYKDLRRIY